MNDRIRCITVALLAFAGSAIAQEDCNNLLPVSFGYAPFDSDQMEVRIQNNGSIGWSYPSLVFYNTNGDSIAWRAAEFFALAGDQVFTLDITHPEAINDGGVYPRLELWTGFNDSLRCQWVLSGQFCYPTICATIHPYVYSADPTAAGTTFNWNITGEAGLVVATGAMTLPLGGVEVMDSVCLPPGNYSLTMSNSSITGDAVTFQMRGQPGSSSSSPQVVLSTGNSSDFTLLEACIDATDAVADLARENLQLSLVAGRMRVQLPRGERVSEVELLDATGRVLHRTTGVQNQLEVDVTGFAPGLLVLSVTTNKNERWTRTLAWTQ